ncbi:FkbM family methyltransferase [Phenylobacterium aquaticum]|uniref:FkbM family methyltransferase n=1 Tax=Phenylobacterium aquaticum TaxID=1763816 RepID=UPI001F5CF56A|nr:FkbM family methyltransferase [Phenylobacterium aquaticum]MCI3132413.1 FkbM family methyltransferase [Phenylobacterium aquaticum]
MDEPLQVMRIGLGDISVEMAYRPGTKDRFTLEENWRKHPYRLSRHGEVARRDFIDAEYQRLVAAGQTPLILDAGANIGASVLFFAWRYPAARIIAIEPEASNFELLVRNCAGRDQITCLQAALASSDGELQLFDPGRSTDAFRTLGEDEPGEHGRSLGAIPAYGVETLMARFAAGAAPLLAKIDIEGAERDVFSAHTAWVEAFPAIAIELHDWMLPGKASSAPFLACVGALGRDFINPVESDIVFSLRNG